MYGESSNITITHRVRQYTTHLNASVNNYDSIITTELNAWTNWQLGSPPYTFLANAKPDLDMVKAVSYKESTLLTTNEPIMMTLTTSALNGMRSPNGEYDPNASAPLDSNGCATLELGAPRMNYGTPAEDTVAHSYHWGIRWLIAKHSLQDYPTSGPCAYKITNMRIISWEIALNNYGTGSGYGASVLGLYNIGRNPHPGNPIYLRPIKADGCPR